MPPELITPPDFSRYKSKTYTFKRLQHRLLKANHPTHHPVPHIFSQIFRPSYGPGMDRDLTRSRTPRNYEIFRQISPRIKKKRSLNLKIGTRFDIRTKLLFRNWTLILCNLKKTLYLLPRIQMSCSSFRAC